MARSVATVVENNFSKGLVTEATGLNFPENSCVDILNCDFDLFGRVARRFGIDREAGWSNNVVDRTQIAITQYLWQNVNGDGSLSLLVVQLGTTLYFYKTNAPSTLSANRLVSTIDLTAFQTTTTFNCGSYECQFSDGLSRLYVTNPWCNNFYVQYFTGSNTVVGTDYEIRIRDFEGIDDGITPPTRPSSLTPAHNYNLINQGWTEAAKITAWNTEQGNYPGNQDVWWHYKSAADEYDPTRVGDVAAGSSKAPNGFFYSSVYNIDRGSLSGLSGLDAYTTTSGAARTSTTAFFAGRVWYAGINAPGYNSKLYFSQIIQTFGANPQVGLCYQAADPTSEVAFALQADDGGVISIPDAGTIYKLVAIQGVLLVFAYNGVYAVTGSSGIGFAANDFTVNRISEFKTISASSFVLVNGVPVWWNNNGIYQIVSQGQSLSAQSLTLSTIQTFYDNIPVANKQFVKGFYSVQDQTAYWLYRSTPANTREEFYIYDSVLVLRIPTGAYSVWRFAEGASVHGGIVLDGTTGVGIPVMKFLVSTVDHDLVSNFTFADLNDQSYVDWKSITGGEDYSSYFVSGYKIHGDGNKQFASDYLTVYHEGEGQFYVQGVWDYALTPNTGRYTTKQLCRFPSIAISSDVSRELREDGGLELREDGGLEQRENPVIVNPLNTSNDHRRLQIRGQGYTLQYRVESVSGEGFNIVGWSTLETKSDMP